MTQPGSEPPPQPSNQPSNQPPPQQTGQFPAYPGYPQGQQGWAQPPPPMSYAGQPGYGYAAPDHSRATVALVLGIIGLAGGVLACGLPLLVSPVAWAIGSGAVRDIDASYGRLGGRGQAQAGKVLGIIGTVLLVLGLLALVGFVVLLIANGSSTGPSVDYPGA